MNKEPKVYKCECCDYNTIKNANLVRHIESKHKKVENNVTEPPPTIQNEETASLKSEILALKAEIENMKIKHQLELLQQKCDLLQQFPQNTIVSRRVVKEPVVEPVVEPVKEPVKEVKESFRKKKSGENTLDYLNKFYDPTTYPIMYSEICKGISKVKPLLSTDDINVQMAEILKPIINNKKLILHSGMDGRTHKLYYVNDNQEWVESITYLEDVKYEMEENNYSNIFDLVYEKFRQLLINFPKNSQDDWLEYCNTYNKKIEPKQIITLIVDGMKLTDDECEQ